LANLYENIVESIRVTLKTCHFTIRFQSVTAKFSSVRICFGKLHRDESEQRKHRSLVHCKLLWS